MIYLSQFLLVLVSLVNNDKNVLTIQFENLRDNRGTLLIGIYSDQAGWKKRKPTYELVVSKSTWINGTMSASIPNLKEGIYGIAVLDDTNDNQHVDMGFIFPEEGFGFSNYEHESWLLPTFEDFDFSYPQSNLVIIKIRYLD